MAQKSSSVSGSGISQLGRSENPSLISAHPCPSAQNPSSSERDPKNHLTFMESKSNNELNSVWDTEGKHNWYIYLHLNLTKLWEQTKLMEIMTKSQIDHYLFDCHKLKLNLSEVEKQRHSLKEFVRELLVPLKSEMQDKNICL